MNRIEIKFVKNVNQQNFSSRNSLVKMKFQTNSLKGINTMTMKKCMKILIEITQELSLGLSREPLLKGKAQYG